MRQVRSQFTTYAPAAGGVREREMLLDEGNRRRERREERTPGVELGR